MEINRFDKVQGVVTTDNIVEGRFVVLTSHSETYGFGSREDLFCPRGGMGDRFPAGGLHQQPHLHLDQRILGEMAHLPPRLLSD